MKNYIIKPFLILGIIIALLSGCTTVNHAMREPNTRVNLTKSDFSLSDQITASATSTKILGIDFKRLFTKKTGVIESNSRGSTAISLAIIPVIGTFVTDKTANYSLYELMASNPGYDVVFYPQYEKTIIKPILGIGFLAKIKNGELNRFYSSRFIGSLVADFHRTLLRGGIFIYPEIIVPGNGLP